MKRGSLLVQGPLATVTRVWTCCFQLFPLQHCKFLFVSVASWNCFGLLKELVGVKRHLSKLQWLAPVSNSDLLFPAGFEAGLHVSFRFGSKLEPLWLAGGAEEAADGTVRVVLS